MSTSSVDSMPSLHDYSGVQVYTTTSTPLCRKRPPGPGPSLRTTPLQDPAHAATYGSWAATSDKGLLQRSTKRPCTLRSSLHGYLRIYCCKRLPALALLSCKRPPGPGDYFVTTALAIQVYFFSNKVRSFINFFTVYSLQRDHYRRVRLLASTPRWGLRTLRSRLRVLIAGIFLSLILKQFITIVFVQIWLLANYYRATGD
jgi:hypothetical protein